MSNNTMGIVTSETCESSYTGMVRALATHNFDHRNEARESKEASILTKCFDKEVGLLLCIYGKRCLLTNLEASGPPWPS